SPRAGAAVPLGEAVTIRTDSHDRLGVEAVTVRAGGRKLTRHGPGRYRYLPEGGKGEVTITAEATDAAGNRGTATRTLKRVEPGESRAGLRFLAPANGAEVRAGATAEVRVALDEAGKARLKAAVDGNPDHPESPATVTLEAPGEKGGTVGAELAVPDVSRASVLRLRLVAGDRETTRYLNVIPDDGIDAEAEVTVRPKGGILGGTRLRAAAQPPEGMADFHPDSRVRVAADVGLDRAFAMDGQPRTLEVPEKAS
ncbi:MAG: hypothetical protein ABEK42_13470, partial [Thiohalorhabdaceae bacterium]